MAGIGFELRKIFKESSILSITAGIGYSALITVGPTIIVMAVLILLYMFLGISSVTYYERELLSTTILYIFIFSAIVTSGVNAIFSRFIADKFFQEEYEDILPSYYTGLLLLGLVATIIAIPFCYRLYVVGGVELTFVLGVYFLWISTIFLYFSMTYLHATKDYKVITISFLIGMIFGALLSIILSYTKAVDTIHSILYGLTFGFFVISSLVSAYIHRYFSKAKSGFFKVLSYFVKYKEIFFSNLLYFLGLYIHNFVFWALLGNNKVAATMISMGPYDMASCLALFTNISTVMIFTVMAETEFHDRYQNYMESVIGSTHREINKNKKKMFRAMKQQIVHVFTLQSIITVFLFLLFRTFLPRLGFGGLTMEIYSSLAASYLVIFITYCLIIYLFYYDDMKGAVSVSLVFCLFIFIGALWSARLSPSLYGAGTFIGALISWSVGYYRLRYLEKHFEQHIFMNQKLIASKKGKVIANLVYEKSGE